MELTSAEIRVLGCLVEKQRTTPDAYPLSLNALRAACNQATNREPVVSYDDATVRDALARLHRRRYTRLASGQGSRAAKHRHLLEEALGIDAARQSVLAVLMLRGPQTPGELRQRTERLHAFADFEALREVLDDLIARGLVERLERRPGQKEERYAHLLGGHDPSDASPAPARAGAPAAAEPAGEPVAARTAGTPAQVTARTERIEDEIAALRAEVATLSVQVAELRAELGLADARPPGSGSAGSQPS